MAEKPPNNTQYTPPTPSDDIHAERTTLSLHFTETLAACVFLSMVVLMMLHISCAALQAALVQKMSILR